MIMIQSYSWYKISENTHKTSHAQYICTSLAIDEFSHGHSQLGIKYLNSAYRSYFTGECVRDSQLQIELHPKAVEYSP